MKLKVITVTLLTTVLFGCNDLEFDINAEEERTKIVLQNEKETKSTLNSEGSILKEAIINRNFDDISMITNNLDSNSTKLITDFILQMDEQESLILENANDERPTYDDDGNIVINVEEVNPEDVIGDIEYIELFDKSNGSYEQFFYYTNDIYDLSLSIVWLGGSIYEVY